MVRYRRNPPEPPGLILFVIFASLVVIGFFYKEESFRKKIRNDILPSRLVNFVEGFFPQTRTHTNAKVEDELPNNASYSWSLDHNVVGQVERVEWSPHIPFVKELIKLREPVILTNTIVSQWKAIELWNTPGYLASHPELEFLEGVQIGPEHTFAYVDNKTALAKERVPGIRLTNNYEVTNMTGSDFFNKINDPNDPYYYYWYGRVTGSLKQDVHPSSYLWVAPEDLDDFGLFMWLSGNDTRPPIHYDQDHNFYVHLAGTKRFVFFPPWEFQNMHPFPRIHPRWHKSQASFDRPDFSRTPNYQKAKAYEALLKPGDVLYVPPYWWHHVQAVTASVSLASWSRSGTNRALEPMYKRETTFDSIQDPTEKISYVKLFIKLLLEKLYGKENTFIKDLLESRWHPLRHIFENLESFKDQSLCIDGEGFPHQGLLKRLEEDVIYSVEQLNLCQGMSLEYKDVRAIRDLEVSDYIEVIASEAVGGERVYAFFMKCF